MMALVVVLMANGALAAQPKRVWVPLVLARIGEPILMPGDEDLQAVYTVWSGNVSAMNPGISTGTVKPTAIYGNFSPRVPPPVYTLPPGTGDCLARGPVLGFTGSPSPGPLGMAELEISEGVVVTAAIERAQYHCGCHDVMMGDCMIVSQGLSEMPVFEQLFPAGSEVVCGDVTLGAPTQDCGVPDSQQYPRRVNVTLFNAADVDASFAVSAVPLWGSSEPIFERAVVVPKRAVVQLNDIPITIVDPSDALLNRDLRVWIRISSDQPYLAYVSTVFEGGVPGSMPFQVFTPRLVHVTAP